MVLTERVMAIIMDLKKESDGLRKHLAIKSSSNVKVKTLVKLTASSTALYMCSLPREFDTWSFVTSLQGHLRTRDPSTLAAGEKFAKEFATLVCAGHQEVLAQLKAVGAHPTTLQTEPYIEPGMVISLGMFENDTHAGVHRSFQLTIPGIHFDGPRNGAGSLIDKQLFATYIDIKLRA